MKKTCIIAAVLVLTLFTMAGCGCRNSKPAATTVPTTLPTVTTVPTEAAATPTTMATTPSTDPIIEDGNGPLSTDATTSTDNTESGNARSRSGGMVGGTGSGNGITGSIS